MPTVAAQFPGPAVLVLLSGANELLEESFNIESLNPVRDRCVGNCERDFRWTTINRPESAWKLTTIVEKY